MDGLIHALASIDAKWVGGVLAAAFLATFKVVGPILSGWVTRLFVRQARELTALEQREAETKTAAALFTRDAEIVRLHEKLVDKQEELDRVTLERDRLEVLVAALEEGKLEAEMELAECKIESKTGRHRALTPKAVPRALDDELDTDRPRSASRALQDIDRLPPTPPFPPLRGPRRDRP